MASKTAAPFVLRMIAMATFLGPWSAAAQAPGAQSQSADPSPQIRRGTNAAGNVVLRLEQSLGNGRELSLAGSPAQEPGRGQLTLSGVEAVDCELALASQGRRLPSEATRVESGTAASWVPLETLRTIASQGGALGVCGVPLEVDGATQAALSLWLSKFDAELQRAHGIEVVDESAPVANEPAPTEAARVAEARRQWARQESAQLRQSDPDRLYEAKLEYRELRGKLYNRFPAVAAIILGVGAVTVGSLYASAHLGPKAVPIIVAGAGALSLGIFANVRINQQRRRYAPRIEALRREITRLKYNQR